MFCTYILYSTTADKHYIGCSANPDHRLKQHNDPLYKSYTSAYAPWSLKIAIPFTNRSVAMKVERYLKAKNKLFIFRVYSNPQLLQYIIDRFG